MDAGVRAPFRGGGIPPGVVMVQPVSDPEFSMLMEALGPFERNSRVAVALSGGPDSMALCLLADTWARRHGGRIVALTVDHGLRSDSTAEAAAVGGWMGALGIAHQVLAWEGTKPRSAVQAKARAARYELLTGWCRRAGILHLVLAHEMEDQAETVLMRLTRGSGRHGLAGMSAVSETAGVRILRPLLGVERARLTATLRSRQQAWVEDPSNLNPAFARIRVRQWLPALAQAGCGAAHLKGLAETFAAGRAESEAQIAALLARACSLLPTGHATLDRAALAAAPASTTRDALSRVLRTVGGGAYPAARDKVEAVRSWMDGGAGPSSVTLGRCRCLRRSDDILVCRENRHLPAPVAIRPGERIFWDERFDIEIGDAAAGVGTALQGDPMLVPLGREGWAEVLDAAPDRRRSAIPYPARLTLPAVRDSAGIVDVPHLGYRRSREAGMPSMFKKIIFSPRNSLSGVGFCLASRVSRTI